MGRHTLAFARALLLLSALVGVLGCAPGRSPELLEVDEVTPHAVERGTHLELGGAGFPDRRVAQVAFVGLVHRPAEAPRAVTVRTTADADSRSHLRLTVGGELLAQFLEGAPHATFRGSVVVGFAARSQDAPALSGKLDGVVLDLFGDQAVRSGAEQSLSEQGKAFSEFLGLKLSESFEVTEVRPGSEGSAPGCCRVTASWRSMACAWTPPPISRRVPMGGRAISRCAARVWASLRVPWTKVAFVRPGSATWRKARLSWLRRWCCFCSLRGDAGSCGPSSRRALPSALPPQVRRAALARVAWLSSGIDVASKLPSGLRWLPYAGFFGISAALSALALGRPLLSEAADLAVLVSVACAASWIAALIHGGRAPGPALRRGRKGGGFRLGRGIVRAAQSFGLFVPVLLGLLGAIYEDGTLGLSELVARQGGWPTEWRALETPWALLALLLVLLAWVPTSEDAPRPPRRGNGWPRQGLAQRLRPSLRWLACWTV